MSQRMKRLKSRAMFTFVGGVLFINPAFAQYAAVAQAPQPLSVLSLIAGIAPMFGFLGTIAGMIQTFFNISITSDITLGTIAGGIYVKMITSATG